LKAYFESDDPSLSKPPTYGTLLVHPLLKTLFVQEKTHERLRGNIVEIINTTVIKGTIAGPQSLERSFMGQLMKQHRGKVQAKVALMVMKEEMRKRLEFIPQGSMFRVRHRTPDEVEALEIGTIATSD
jgi:hypothetical protein